jgi:hypothetical protein
MNISKSGDQFGELLGKMAQEFSSTDPIGPEYEDKDQNEDWDGVGIIDSSSDFSTKEQAIGKYYVMCKENGTVPNREDLKKWFREETRIDFDSFTI